MTPLSPAPQSLGLASPALAPWFADSSITLAVPNDDLSVTLSALSISWQAPVTGLLSFRVVESPRSADLALLRQANGEPAFTDGRLVAVFRLLPEVEARLASLMNAIPALDGSDPSDAVTRQPVRYLAMELVSAPATVSTLATLVDPPALGDTDVERAQHLGFTESGGSLVNADSPIRDLKRVGQTLLKFEDLTSDVNLWAFDQRGRAVDPGAVAAWWQYLGTHAFTNLWQDAAQNRTVAATAHRSVHLVNAHAGPLADDPVLARLQGLTGTGVVRTVSGTEAIALSFSSAPDDAPDDAPVPKLALLPSGTYGDTLSIWAGGPVRDELDNLIERDYARVALVDVESHLVGQRRTSDAAADSSAARRDRDQHHASTRVRIAQAAPLAPFSTALLSITDEAADAAVATLSAPGNSTLVTSILSRDWGGLDLATLPDVAPPESLPDFQVQALQGGGTATDGTLASQQVLLTFSLAGALADAWVRAWTQGFDPDRGRHLRLSGGGARVRTDGAVSLVITLSEGSVETAAPLGFELLILTAQGAQLFTDLRFERPAPIGGAALDWGSVAPATNLVLCEQGQVLPHSSMAGQLASGTTLYADQSPPALINQDSISPATFRDDTAIRQLSSGDQIQLTQPAFRTAPQGDSIALLAATGATVQQQTRSGLDRLLEAGDPIPTMERLEIVAVQSETAAAIATTPALARYHELPPHQLGHPGAPASVEIHGTGAALSGPVVELLAEFSRDRTATTTPDLITAAVSPLTVPSTPAAATLWAAPLRTVAAGVEAELNPTQLANLLNAPSPYPFGQGLDAIRNWLQTGPGAALTSQIPLPASVDAAADSVVRALDRRLLAAARGLQEGATSLLAAFARAEDFVYLETPAFDGTEFGNSDDLRSLLSALTQRLSDRRALQVILCVPIDPLPGTPKALWRVRNALLLDAINTLRTAAGVERVAVFSPNAGVGRTVRLAATTVIVDDAYVMTGTTHLWRRGLTFDASIAISLFDEQLQAGLPSQIQRFSQELIAERLGLATPSLVPEDAVERTQAIRQLANRSGNRLAVQPISEPDPDPSDTDKAMWNRDGSDISGGFDPLTWLRDAISAGQADELQQTLPD